jgi:xanthine dehydrogenase YagT iron-sulfur-binding subunit
MLKARAPLEPGSPARPGVIDINLMVNGDPRHLKIEPWTTLLDLLRDGLGLTGTKK